MKIALIIIAVLGVFGSVTYNLKTSEVGADTTETEAMPTPQQSSPNEPKSPVLVELFTSEGCSSCPPADKNLIYFNEKQPVADAEVITLSMHVDYWNRLGWTDPFSSAKYSERQGMYSDTFGLGQVYTPQMVVDGARQFVGSNAGEATNAIVAASKSRKAKVELAITENKLRVNISDIPEPSLTNVFVAIAEDNLSTVVARGENGGRILSHDSVVRELRVIGTIAEKAKSFETETMLEIQPAWKKQNLKIVVFAQSEKGGRITGVNQIKF